MTHGPRSSQANGRFEHGGEFHNNAKPSVRPDSFSLEWALGSVGAMTLEAVEAATAATHRRYEAYTALWPDEELNLLEQTIGPIQRVMRPEVEQPEDLFALASTSLVALLVVGDPLQATTHVDLQLQAAEAGIECRVFHGISITTLVTGAIGLSNYRFGRQTTLTYPYGGWVATSPLETIIVNRFTGLHTLALLDLDPTGLGTGDQRPMMPGDAVASIDLMRLKIEEGLTEREFSDDNPFRPVDKGCLAIIRRRRCVANACRAVF